MSDRPLGDPLRIVAAIPVVVYVVILAAGLFLGEADASTREGGVRLGGLVLGCALLIALEVLGRTGHAWQGRVAVGLAARLLLLALVALCDTSGVSRAVFVLVPFLAAVAYGVRRGAIVATVALVLVAASLAINTPDYASAGPWPDVLMLAIGIMLALTMAAVAREAEHSRARIANLAAAAERARVAREIHDSLGHHLTAVSLQLDKAVWFATSDRGTSDHAVQTARDSARAALRDVRLSVRALRGHVPVPHLTTALEELVQQVRDDRLDVALEVVGSETDVDVATRMTMFRAAQEALTNVRRHSGARRADLVLACAPSRTELTIRDDGTGFREGAEEGFGLMGMRERVAQVGGVLEVSSAPGQGTTIRVAVAR